MGIAKHTRVRCSSREIFVNKIVNDKITKLVFDVEDIMCEAMLHSGHAGIVKAVQVAAIGFFFTTAAGSIVPGFHGDAYHFVAFIMEHEGGDGTVNTATHRHQNFSFFTHKNASCKYTKAYAMLFKTGQGFKL